MDAQGLRAYLWLPSVYRDVVSEEVGEIQAITGTVEFEGMKWHIFELPKFDSNNAFYFVVTCSDGRDRHCLRIANTPRLPERKLVDEVARLANEGSDDEASDLLHKAGFHQGAREGIQVAKLIDRYSELVYRLTKTARCLGPFADVNRDGIFARPVRRVSSNWRRIGKSRTPPLSLIVRLADEIPVVLEEVCNAPRVVLKRQRELESASRVQQVDSACIRWIGRQPGRSLSEKAGPRQRLMGVVRREDCDTSENRVVMDLLVRCKRAGELYLARHREFASHKRLVMVRRFVRLCDRLIRQSKISEVGKLVGIAQPNYVLQHEPRYTVLWDAYQRLIRHEKVTQSSWIWRDRLWNEWVGLGLIGAMSVLSYRCPAYRKSISFSDEPSLGEFQTAESVGPWWIKRHTTPVNVHLIPRSEILRCDGLPSQLKQLNPDFVIASLETKGQGIAIWTNLDVIHTRETAVHTAKELAAQTDATNLSRWKFLVLTGGSRQIETGPQSEFVQWATLPLMLQDHFESWTAMLHRMLSHAS